jgi:mannitol/fructose-specific phosphotransferase system IIA component (Ntr-type)
MVVTNDDLCSNELIPHLDGNEREEKALQVFMEHLMSPPDMEKLSKIEENKDGE